MKTKILFPNHFKRIGWIILIPSAVLGVLSVFDVIKFDFLNNVKMFAIYSDDMFNGGRSVFGFVKNNISDEILGILCIVGAILVAFSKEKHEDEFIAKIRMESLVWATYINYAILILCMLFFYSIGFLYVMIFNMFTILIFFIIRFYYQLYKSNKSMSHEK
jgi:small-conductance mechanosensitive channel